jgi:hypothetical protein
LAFRVCSRVNFTLLYLLYFTVGSVHGGKTAGKQNFKNLELVPGLWVNLYLFFPVNRHITSFRRNSVLQMIRGKGTVRQENDGKYRLNCPYASHEIT